MAQTHLFHWGGWAALRVVAIGFAALFVFSPDVAEDQTWTPPPPGRYQIVFSPLMRADTYLLDTTTGQVWRQVTASHVNGEPSVWERMERLEGDNGAISYSEFVKRYGAKISTSAAATAP
jgi:hypothetical protein